MLQENPHYWAVTEKLGFLPSAAQENHSLTDGGSAEIIAAENLAQDLPHIEDAEVLGRLAALGEIKSDSFHAFSPTQTEAALRAYTFVACRLIHRGHLGPGRTLDPRVAQPLWLLAQRVGRAPSLTYATYVLANWRNPVRRRTPPEDFTVQTTFTGTPDEAWFVAVHLSIESVGGEIVEGLARCEHGVVNDAPDDVAAGFAAVESALRWSTSVFPRIEERLDAGVFTEKVREFLFGYQDVTFGGVEGAPTVSYVGETGAQSGAIRAADAGLGVGHSADVLASMTNFLSYAPATHHSYLEKAAELGGEVRKYLDVNPGLAESHRNAKSALSTFRDTHLGVVKKYLVGAKSPYPDQGTGGTQYQHWLRKLVEESTPENPA